MYTGGTSCSTNVNDYPNLSGVSMSQSTETNNGKYICLFGQDAAGNITTLLSLNDINIDITAPTFTFANNS